MEKISFARKESLHDFNIPKIHDEIVLEHDKQYDKILTQALTNYLGRPLELVEDGKLTTLVETPDGNRHLIYDDVEVGVIYHQIGYEFDDFENNRVTLKISFVPNTKI